MNTLYHDRGHLRALVKPAWRHAGMWVNDAAYRALHRFARQLRRLPSRQSGTVLFARRPIQFVDGPSFLSAWDEIFVNRIYDIRTTADQPLLVDVGANIGLAALRWKMLFPRFRYLGFEPDPNVAKCCRANLAAWDIAGELRETAVGAATGAATFQPDGADGGRVTSGGAGASALTVSIELLSPHLDRPVDLLKLDVEGSEGEILIEIAPHLAKVRNLFVEWHYPNDGARALGDGIRLLEEAGFHVVVQVAAGPRVPFLDPAPAGLFLQQLNLYAIRR